MPSVKYFNINLFLFSLLMFTMFTNKQLFKKKAYEWEKLPAVDQDDYIHF